MDRLLILENGTVFKGVGFGSNTEKICELVLNTSMVGYQEIVSDPSYCEQTVLMTYPLIGNYGLADEDYETKIPSIGGLIVREINDRPSNFRYSKTLNEYMTEYDIPGISEIDTRMLARIIRSEGSMKCMITTIDTDISFAMTQIQQYVYPTNQISRVTCKNMWRSRTPNMKYNVVAIDCGIKLNIVRKLNELGCNVLVVPYGTTSEEIMDLKPDGLILSNGPGDPKNATAVIKNVEELQGKLPIFGICLGHQIIALANKAETYKLKFGHRGGNHPVMNLENNKVEITSQNHSYAVMEESLHKSNLTKTHINLLDNTIEGLASKEELIFSVQYHPESTPGPQDSTYLFDIFIKNIEESKGV